MVTTCRCYLVRDSSSVPNAYVLTMYAKSVPRNFQIMAVIGIDLGFLLACAIIAFLFSPHSMRHPKNRLCIGLMMALPSIPSNRCWNTTRQSPTAFHANLPISFHAHQREYQSADVMTDSPIKTCSFSDNQPCVGVCLCVSNYAHG